MWTNNELDKIARREGCESLAPRRHTAKPVIIWVVRLGDDLYVRSVNGRSSGWFRGVLVRYEGRIWAGGVEKDVTFVEVTDPEVNDQIDAAYRLKYRRYPQYVAPLFVPAARLATIKLVPR
jgi:hypothetical protein